MMHDNTVSENDSHLKPIQPDHITCVNEKMHAKDSKRQQDVYYSPRAEINPICFTLVRRRAARRYLKRTQRKLVYIFALENKLSARRQGLSSRAAARFAAPLRANDGPE